MGFSFRLKKKKETTAPTGSGAAGKKSSTSKKQSKSRRTNAFKTPLGTIRENGGGTDKTMPTTPVITNVSVMENPDGGTELVFGDIPKMADETEKDEPSLLAEEKDEDVELEVKEEDVKKKLFAEEDEPMKSEEDKKTEPVVFTSVHDPVVVDKPFDEPLFDEPFDQKEMKKEDPYMLELMQTESYDEKERVLKRQQMLRSRAIPQTREQEAPATKGIQDAAQNLMEVFACNSDTTMFYDALCADPQVRTRKRPFFSEEFAIHFIKEATEDGIPMLYHVPPTNPIDNDWTGQSMDMYIRPGDCTGAMTRHPKLVWMTASGGYSRLTGTAEVLSFAVGLMDIHSIMDSMDDDEDDDGEDLFFFSITTNSGDVHLFECPTEDERDRMVAGIKNIIARMSFSLVAGDEVVMSELYGGDEEEEGELPSLRTPQQEMATVSHEFLDSIAPGILPKLTTSTLIEV